MSPDPSDAELDDVARRARAAEAVRDRHRRAAAATRLVEGTTVVSALLGAIGSTVTIRTAAGIDALTAAVSAVGDDVVELVGPTRTWWLALDQVAAVDAERLPPGDAADRSTTSLRDLLTDLVDSDVPIEVTTRGGDRLAGAVASVGATLTLRSMSSDRTTLVVIDHVVAVARRGRPPE